MYKTITIDVDVDIDVEDALNQMDDSDLVEELQSRGFYVSEDDVDEDALLTDEEKDYICRAMLSEHAGNDMNMSSCIYEKLRKR
jgi:hypothetical protein